MRGKIECKKLEPAILDIRTTPSFDGLVPASPSSSRAKQRNRSKDTAHELALRKLLWGIGLRYRKNVGDLPGKPDIVFLRERVAIFCDGDFWHGRNWDSLSQKLSTGNNPSYWVQKIRSNRERDLRNNRRLSDLGWLVLRFWETDMHGSPDTIIAEIILSALRKRNPPIA
jgi:DNA mismatch endonuclease, patch repair protein